MVNECFWILFLFSNYVQWMKATIPGLNHLGMVSYCKEKNSKNSLIPIKPDDNFGFLSCIFEDWIFIM
jgi:hypothetical protein